MNSDLTPGAGATGLASETLIACLTPPGKSAIAALSIRGPRAWEIVRRLFRTNSAKQLPVAPEPGRVWLGRMGEIGTATADEVVVTVPKTTPVLCVEVHCHGGWETVRWLTDMLEGQGCRACTWQELERATSADFWKTTANLELAQTLTTRTARILLDQYHGTFAAAIAAIRTALQKSDSAEAMRLLDASVRYADVGRHLTVPWKVAVIGPPNVGKSSLVNALAGFQRCVVDPTPGTTRDLVTTLIAVDGWPVELIDTAGLREEAGSLEGEGILLAREAAATADLCLWILDASSSPIWPEDGLRDNNKLKRVVNKIDLPATWDTQKAPALSVSARTSAGLTELVEAMARWLVPDPPAPGAAVPFTSFLATQIEQALDFARGGRLPEAEQILAVLANDAR